MSVTVARRDLSEPMADAYRQLRQLRDGGATAAVMRDYVSGLNGALDAGEHDALERWVRAEECEPTVRRRWTLNSDGSHHRLVPAVTAELRRGRTG